MTEQKKEQPQDKLQLKKWMRNPLTEELLEAKKE